MSSNRLPATNVPVWKNLISWTAISISSVRPGCDAAQAAKHAFRVGAGTTCAGARELVLDQFAIEVEEMHLRGKSSTGQDLVEDATQRCASDGPASRDRPRRRTAMWAGEPEPVGCRPTPDRR